MGTSILPEGGLVMSRTKKIRGCKSRLFNLFRRTPGSRSTMRTSLRNWARDSILRSIIILCMPLRMWLRRRMSTSTNSNYRYGIFLFYFSSYHLLMSNRSIWWEELSRSWRAVTQWWQIWQVVLGIHKPRETPPIIMEMWGDYRRK